VFDGRRRQIGKDAAKLNISGGVLQKDLSEPADGAQRMVFFYRSLYDEVKQLLQSARLTGKQHTQFEKVFSAGPVQARSAGMGKSTEVTCTKSAWGTQALTSPHFQCS
jgi:hypothetical protein